MTQSVILPITAVRRNISSGVFLSRMLVQAMLVLRRLLEYLSRAGDSQIPRDTIVCCFCGGWFYAK